MLYITDKKKKKADRLKMVVLSITNFCLFQPELKSDLRSLWKSYPVAVLCIVVHVLYSGCILLYIEYGRILLHILNTDYILLCISSRYLARLL